MLSQVMELQLCLLKKTDFSKQLPAFIRLLMKVQKIDGDNPKLVSFVHQWMLALAMMLNKERKVDSSFRPKVQEAFKSLYEYYGDTPGNPFENKKGNQVFVVDVVEGMLCLTKGDLVG